MNLLAINNKIISLLPVVVFLLITILFKEWFFSDSVLTNGDWYLIPNQNSLEFKILSLFNPNSLGIGDGSPWLRPLLHIMAFLASLNLSPGLITRIVFILPGIAAAYWGTYLWVKNINGNVAISVFSALVMLLNTYLLTLSTGHLTHYSAICFIPLSIYLLNKFINIPNKLSGRLALWFYFLNSLLISFYEIRVFTIYFILMSFYTLVISYKKSLFIKLIAILPLVGVGLTSSYWILPLITSSASQFGEYLNRDIFGNQFLNINYAITITQPFWTLRGSTPFENAQIFFLYWVIPLGVIFMLWKVREHTTHINAKSQNIYLVFAILFLIGVFLSKQSSIPYNRTYRWLFNNVPYFVMYREATKFFSITIIGFIGIIGGIAYKKLDNLTKILLFLVLCSVSINAIPVLTGKIGGVYNPAEIPSIYTEINTILENDTEQFNTVWVPQISRWSYYRNDNPRVSYSDLAIMYKKQFPTVDRRSFELINDDKFIELLADANLKYLIVVNDSEFDNHGDAEKIKSIIYDRPDKYTIISSDDDYVLIRNNSYGSKINVYLTREAFNLYKINISGNTDSNFYMPVKYDPNWKITTNTSLTETVLRKNWVNTAVSRPTSNGLQEFNVPTNPDLPNELYIQYIPDAYHKVGFILSGIFFVLVSVIIFFPIKNRIELVK